MASSFKSPADTAKACVGIAALKEKAPLSNLLLLSFLAGAYIAFGGLLAEVATGGLAAVAPPGMVKLIFGAVFPVGLMLVVIAGSELFTGNCMYMPLGILQGEASIMGLIRNWLGSWVFNLIGALFVAYFLAVASGILATPPFSGAAIQIAQTKALGGAQFIGAAGTTLTSITWGEAFWRAIGCNWLVCLAVYLAIASDDVIGKVLGIWFPIMAFVTIGFEHSVANMFFIPVGIFLGGGVTWSQFFINNMIPVTLGNIVGGAVFVAVIYWWTYLRGTGIPKAEAPSEVKGTSK